MLSTDAFSFLKVTVLIAISQGSTQSITPKYLLKVVRSLPFPHGILSILDKSINTSSSSLEKLLESFSLINLAS
jgi:hypothetical protein